MNTEEIQEGNRAIALFMGLQISDAGQYSAPDTDDLDGSYSFVHPRYHLSWDWLMPVVDRIESLGYFVQITSEAWYIDEEDRTDKARTQHMCLILKDYRIVINSSGHGGADRTNKLLAVYAAVVSFIKWYNQQSK